jgi:protein-tyrosine kinase
MSAAMNRQDDARSLIERAAEVYDFGAALKGRQGLAAHAPADAGALEAEEPQIEAAPAFAGAQTPTPTTTHSIDRARLKEGGFILPDAPVGTLAEEFRLVKRQLLLRGPGEAQALTAKDRMILVCSAQPNDGKTFCAVNLAISLASERDNEVLLVDADVAKPDVLSTLGLSGEHGLIDAIADPDADVERFIIATDIAKLSVLPAGKATNNDTELLASARAAKVIESLATNNPRRIVILDSAPALAASPASVLAHRVGRVLMVVRADRTSEAELREAIALLDGCDDISLLLNGASFFGSNRTYGSYYGQDQ